ncbi:Hypothetical_protein [Hexamita inflata]|uniref:Hypothetical_protein n=1 Tax=Hexamita inflata TaxID=28002 RepID=A0AA86QSS4_9EUKA|nr:Hypothetical protein HINF_LOCUS51013 [Hexamita inflata]
MELLQQCEQIILDQLEQHQNQQFPDQKMITHLSDELYKNRQLQNEVEEVGNELTQSQINKNTRQIKLAYTAQFDIECQINQYVKSLKQELSKSEINKTDIHKSPAIADHNPLLLSQTSLIPQKSMVRSIVNQSIVNQSQGPTIDLHQSEVEELRRKNQWLQHQVDSLQARLNEYINDAPKAQVLAEHNKAMQLQQLKITELENQLHNERMGDSKHVDELTYELRQQVLDMKQNNELQKLVADTQIKIAQELQTQNNNLLTEIEVLKAYALKLEEKNQTLEETIQTIKDTVTSELESKYQQETERHISEKEEINRKLEQIQKEILNTQNQMELELLEKDELIAKLRPVDTTI